MPMLHIVENILHADVANRFNSDLLLRLCDLLDGKGGGKGRFNAKINKLKNIPQIEQKVKDFLSEREK